MARVSKTVLKSTFIFLVLLSSACKTTARNSQSKHQFRNTSSLKTAPDCKDIADEYEKDTAKYPIAAQYIKKLATFIIEHPQNRDTFVSPYDLKGFCFSIKQDSQDNASGNANGRISFWTGRILTAKNDADLATTLSHELAHVTMQHGEKTAQHSQLFNSVFESLNKHMAETESLLSSIVTDSTPLCEKAPEPCKEALKSLSYQLPIRPSTYDQEDLIPDAKKLANMLPGSAINESLGLLEQKMLEGRELKKQWLQLMQDSLRIGRDHELEADEVGFEIYLRAGFKMEHYAQRHIDPSIPLEECLSRKAETFDTHPSGCFRAYNINIEEIKRHDFDYKDYLDNSIDGNIVENPSLQDAIQEIRTVSGQNGEQK